MEIQSDTAWMQPTYHLPSDIETIAIRFLNQNRVRVVDQVQEYIRLVEQLRSVYVSQNLKGRGLWDQTQNRRLQGEELLGLVTDPVGLLPEIKNPGGETYRTAEKVFLLVARAVCGSQSGAATLGAIATKRNRKKVCKHLKTYNFD